MAHGPMRCERPCYAGWVFRPREPDTIVMTKGEMRSVLPAKLHLAFATSPRGPWSGIAEREASRNPPPLSSLHGRRQIAQVRHEAKNIVFALHNERPDL